MICIKSKKEIELMREGGKKLAFVMEGLGKAVYPGNNTLEIDKLARKLVFDMGGEAVFEGYGDKENPFPAAICASLNDEIVHGIPKENRTIQNGDIVKIDIGMKYKGMITDMARTFPAGKISKNAQKLMDATRECLIEGIKKIGDGKKLSEYGRTVENYVRSRGFSVVQDLVGHGVGRELHEDPQVPNYFLKGRDIILREGMTLALEPMINEGSHEIRILPDGWTFATKDGKLSAHFEDTVVVTKNGVEILTG